MARGGLPGVLLATAFLVAAPVAEAVDWRANQLRTPRKITVGPADNAGASLAADGTLYFERLRDQVPAVMAQDPGSARPRRLVPGSGDTRSPAAAPAGRRVALVSYADDARGDICLTQPGQQGLNCLTEPGHTERAPFWVDADHLGWLTRPAVGEPWSLVVRDLASGTEKTVARGALAAPTASPDGRWIAYQRAGGEGERPQLVLHDRASGERHRPPRFALPGITGSLAFGRDGAYLYFTHYLNDTSLDQVIDGADHGVLFRVRTERLRTAEAPFLPEQLTSVGRNCRFPAPGADHLYMTCAFEGSLDVYRLPLAGAVPADWGADKLWAGYRAARTPADRLLLLNALRHRHGGDAAEQVQRLLSHHLAIGELRAAGYYVARLEQRYAGQRPRLAAFYRMLDTLLAVRRAEKRQPQGAVTAAFLRRVAAERDRLGERDLRPAQRDLLAAYLAAAAGEQAAAAGEQAAALNHLDGLDLGGAELLPLGRYLAFDLYQRLLADTEPERLLALYPALFGGPDLSRQTRLFYAYHYLARLARLHPERAERERRLAERLEATDNEAIAELLHTERAALELAAAEGLQAKAPIYRDLRDRLTASKNDPLLRRVQHTRAIQILGAAGDYRFMERLSRHWLLVTPIEGMGFPHVAAQYAVTVKDQAYGLLAEGAVADAYNAFYGVLRQTDDLEAHYRYITLGTRRLDRSDEVERSYRILRERDLLGHSDRYVRALRLLLRAGDDAEPARIQEAIAQLEDLPPTGASPAMGRLLLGYAHHRLLDADSTGGYDRARFEQAHHHYMLALDLAHDSTRIRAAVLQNLGFLHRQAGNHATAAAFYRRRATLPFAEPVTEAAVRWQLARALFYIDRPGAAHDQAEAALAVAEAQTDLPTAPFREKAAFYAVQAGAYPPALRHYRQLRGAGALSGEGARSVRLGYGYALLKAGESDRARAVLGGLADAAAADARLRLLALGLWAEAAADPAEEARLRRRRVALWRAHADEPQALGYNAADRRAFLSKDLQQVAAAEARRGRPAAAREAISAALATARQWAETTGQPAGQPLYRALVNYLALAAEHPAAFADKPPKGLEKAVTNARTALTEGPVVPPAARARALKLGLLWTAHQGDGAPAALLETQGARKLAEADPAAYRELETLARALTPSAP